VWLAVLFWDRLMRSVAWLAIAIAVVILGLSLLGILSVFLLPALRFGLDIVTWIRLGGSGSPTDAAGMWDLVGQFHLVRTKSAFIQTVRQRGTLLSTRDNERALLDFAAALKEAESSLAEELYRLADDVRRKRQELDSESGRVRLAELVAVEPITDQH
jgi:hypothetical protein